MIALVAACGDQYGDDDPANGTPIRACDDIDVTGMTSANIDTFVAMYEGRPCERPLEGGISGLQQECQYGATLTVCGQSSGLSQFGCSCGFENRLSCSNGERFKEGQERLCDGGM